MGAYLDSSFNKEIRAIQAENASLQSQQILHLDFKEHDNAGNQMKELIEVAGCLRSDLVKSTSTDSKYSISKPPQASAVTSRSYFSISATKEEEEDDWPDPSP